ncbi:BMP family ABC transporter substrate-binding protein [Paucibacter sp. PLA-PC-4]|uniref:BMP family ABC transporter substrate-binding protein n=1 Tax=Paucibacter sp. PLA-PC-4 TaxID=2993655 RepID=UPI002249139D|nr:BMP family ABC transporter substrate-binding protein [Paucibacter sp. PLA-PC-4]MCX2860895.1 BMP family ABC transporter substrate-binding protein [Paucibacter sp. PLA-PC-4]
MSIKKSKRELLKLAGWSSLAATAALVGCGKKEEAAAPAAASEPASATAAPKPEPLKIAFAYVGPVGDGGWTFAHDNGRKAVEAEFGDKIVTSYVEKVPESADAERVFRDMVTQGNKLIFGTTFGYMEPMMKVAPDAKDVKFEHATGYKQAENMRTYDSRTYEGAYMAGVIAGKMTKSNTLGVVGSIPIPEVIRNINSFTLGAQSTNPKIKVKVVWVNEWFNPPKETEAAQSLINGGADVLMQNTDSSAVLQTAEKNGKFAFGWDSDMTAYGPKAHLGSAIINWAPYYIASVREALDGKWTAGPGKHAWWGVKEGAIDMVSINEVVPAEVKAQIDTIRAGLKDGSFSIWKGPITGQDGKPVLKDGEVADDKFLSGVNFYIQGVEGKVPSGK